jgi:hypothetical protein
MGRHRLRTWVAAVSLAVGVGACSGGASSGGHGGGFGGGGRGGGESGGGGGRGGDVGGNGGPGGGGAGGTTGGGGAGGSSGSAGAGGGPAASLEGVVSNAPVVGFTAPRPDYGAVIVANDGDRIYAVESRRDVEPGPLGIPWRSRFRLAAYDSAAAPAWTFAAAPDDVVSDVAVHRSGEVTIAVLHYALERRSYDLVRLARDGSVLGTMTLSEPQSMPATDFGASDPRPMFRMKSDFADATVGGWVRLLPDGEGLVATFLSYVDVPSDNPLSLRMAMGVAAFDRQAGAYVERWARVVEGPHAAQPAAWTYDELRQDEQAIRPFLTRDETTGDILVARAWNNSRCKANVTAFAEFTMMDCALGAVSPIENQWLPLAVTRFAAAGQRLGTRILVPGADAAEQVAFALVARDGKLATAGFVVRKNADGTQRTYPDPTGYVDYDGMIAVYDGDGRALFHHDFNMGGGDVLASLRWLPNDIVAVGSSGWDRWQGGNSISRGADPLLVWLSPDGARAASRTIPMSDGSRHFNLFDLTVTDHAVIAHGFSDAPMTHSADGGNTAARTFGPLRVRLDR